MPDLYRRFPMYSRLLRLYPSGYRKEYEAQMLQTFADMLDGASSPAARAVIRARLVVDIPLSLAQQQINYVGGIMVHETPKFVKYNAAIAGALLIPFVAAVAANSLDQAFRRQTLYTSWAWSTAVLRVWVLWLPAAAAALAAVSLVAYWIQRKRSTGQSWASILLQLQYSWPLVIALCAGLFVLALLFGHDSVHCVTGNPVSELRNLHQTWTCIQRG